MSHTDLSWSLGAMKTSISEQLFSPFGPFWSTAASNLFRTVSKCFFCRNRTRWGTVIWPSIKGKIRSRMIRIVSVSVSTKRKSESGKFRGRVETSLDDRDYARYSIEILRENYGVRNFIPRHKSGWSSVRTYMDPQFAPDLALPTSEVWSPSCHSWIDQSPKQL